MTNLRLVLGCAVAIVALGCFSEPDTSVFGADVVAEELCRNEALDDAEGDIDCGGGCDACVDGRTCLVDSDCASGVCVPTMQPFGETVGRCWGPGFDSCVPVAVDPTINTTMCSNLSLTICQSTPIPEMWTACFGPMTTDKPWDAQFFCCPGSMFGLGEP